jgi:thymidine phosphorylase
MTVIRLGGGRTSPEQTIDHAVGLTEVVGLGAEVDHSQPLAIVHARTANDAERAAADVEASFGIAADTTPEVSEIYERIVPQVFS